MKCDKLAVTEDEPPAAYTRALEERVAMLEMRLAASTPSPRQSRHDTAPAPARDDVLGEVVDVLSMGNFEAPAYVGASSGFGLALNLGHMVQATVWNKAMPSSSSPGGKERSGSVSGTGAAGGAGKALTMEELMASSAEPPGEELGETILNAYFAQLGVRYPFLHPDEIWGLHAERFALRATPVQDLTRMQRYGLFKLYMIYAIGAMLVRLTEKTATPPPESYYMSALQHICAAKESRTVHNIEAMLLLVLYHLRSASNHGIWYMIGLAMRTCIDLGLHRRRDEVNHHQDPLAVQMRRRLFWTIYLLERVIAISLGRPFSIPDRQIDVDLPDEFFNTAVAAADGARSPSAVFSTSPTGSIAGVGKARRGSTWAPATLFILLIQVRRLESKIQYSIYRADKPLTSLLSKVEPIFQELEKWKQTTAEKLGSQPKDFHYAMLSYHKSLWLLVQPFLPLLSPSDAYYQACIRAAGEICQTHKHLHQSLDYGHSFIAVQTVFVSGITLLYALWTHQRDAWSVTLSNDIRACSLVLFVMGERAPWVRKYRDAFELLVTATMDKLENGGTSNLAQTAAANCGLLSMGGNSSSSSSKINGTNTAAGSPRGSPRQQKQQQQHNNNNNNNHKSILEAGRPAAMLQGLSDQMAMAGSAVASEDAWRVVAELTSWIDQSDSSPVWMPDFESLQNLQSWP
ncbi:fungal-specific transcription factor domain-containing protein [Microdochium trichocladiopsis]|uniref:Fungal-specific transcription factor domain-containing protein n=1 Tax=Microdochium trichocladiopsis TaxID=1682393 RepID=A0A9P8YHH7_9PEZI|nr:fungal-specific transcription factor domain-containing protein [Microdochium trichocladiopsis]KAH7038049.1 fungal-specific transcription factor domain-containing protein [Microdochium trichocladiopsis]